MCRHLIVWCGRSRPSVRIQSCVVLLRPPCDLTDCRPALVIYLSVRIKSWIVFIKGGRVVSGLDCTQVSQVRFLGQIVMDLSDHELHLGVTLNYDLWPPCQRIVNGQKRTSSECYHPPSHLFQGLKPWVWSYVVKKINDKEATLLSDRNTFLCLIFFTSW